MKFRNKTQRQLREKELQQQKLDKYMSTYKSYDCFRSDRLTQTQNNDIMFLTKKIRRITSQLNPSIEN